MLILKKKIKKSVDDIILSIKYKCLKEDIRNVNENRAEISKKMLLTKDKELKSFNEHINYVKKTLTYIESTNKPLSYLILEDNKLTQKLSELEKNTNFERIKYYIAIEVILDADIINCKSRQLVFENIATVLFLNKGEMAKIENVMYQAYTFIAGKKQSSTDTEIVSIIKAPLNLVIDFIKNAPNKLMVAGGVAAEFITGAVFKKIAQLGKAKKLSKLPSDTFLYSLFKTAVYLYFEKQAAASSLEYYNIFKQYIKEVNLTRNIIVKNIYEKWFEVKDNQAKLNLLANFDRYLLEQVEFIKK